MQTLIQIKVEDGQGHHVIPSPGQGYFTDWRVFLLSAGETVQDGRLIIDKEKTNYVYTSGDISKKGVVDITLNDLNARINTWFTKKKLSVSHQDKIVIDFDCSGSIAMTLIIQATFNPDYGSLIRVQRTFDPSATQNLGDFHVPFNGTLVAIERNYLSVETTEAGGAIEDYNLYLKKSTVGTDTDFGTTLGDREDDDAPVTGAILYGKSDLFSDRVAAEQNNPKAFKYATKFNIPVSLGDYFTVERSVVYGSAIDTVYAEYFYYFIFKGENDE